MILVMLFSCESTDYSNQELNTSLFPNSNTTQIVADISVESQSNIQSYTSAAIDSSDVEVVDLEKNEQEASDIVFQSISEIEAPVEDLSENSATQTIEEQDTEDLDNQETEAINVSDIEDDLYSEIEDTDEVVEIECNISEDTTEDETQIPILQEEDAIFEDCSITDGVSFADIATESNNTSLAISDAIHSEGHSSKQGNEEKSKEDYKVSSVYYNTETVNNQSFHHSYDYDGASSIGEPVIKQVNQHNTSNNRNNRNKSNHVRHVFDFGDLLFLGFLILLSIIIAIRNIEKNPSERNNKVDLSAKGKSVGLPVKVKSDSNKTFDSNCPNNKKESVNTECLSVETENELSINKPISYPEIEASSIEDFPSSIGIYKKGFDIFCNKFGMGKILGQTTLEDATIIQVVFKHGFEELNLNDIEVFQPVPIKHATINSSSYILPRRIDSYSIGDFVFDPNYGYGKIISLQAKSFNIRFEKGVKTISDFSYLFKIKNSKREAEFDSVFGSNEIECVISPYLEYSIGERVYSEEYGCGVITKTDSANKRITVTFYKLNIEYNIASNEFTRDIPKLSVYFRSQINHTFRIGEYVESPKYGKGQITSITFKGKEISIIVIFDNLIVRHYSPNTFDLMQVIKKESVKNNNGKVASASNETSNVVLKDSSKPKYKAVSCSEMSEEEKAKKRVERVAKFENTNKSNESLFSENAPEYIKCLFYLKETLSPDFLFSISRIEDTNLYSYFNSLKDDFSKYNKGHNCYLTIHNDYIANSFNFISLSVITTNGRSTGKYYVGNGNIKRTGYLFYKDFIDELNRIVSEYNYIFSFEKLYISCYIKRDYHVFLYELRKKIIYLPISEINCFHNALIPDFSSLDKWSQVVSYSNMISNFDFENRICITTSKKVKFLSKDPNYLSGKKLSAILDEYFYKIDKHNYISKERFIPSEGVNSQQIY